MAERLWHLKLTNRLIPVEQILIEEDRQRGKISDEDVLALSETIPTPDALLHPITVQPTGKDTYRLVAGERRLRVFKWMHRVTDTAGWDKIPCRVTNKDLSAGELQLIELLENLSRRDLTWQEECEAVLRIYEDGCEADDEYTLADLSGLLQKSDTFARGRVKVGRALREKNPLIADAQSARAAQAALDRSVKRDISKELVTFDLASIVPASGDKMDDLDIDIDLGGGATEPAESPQKILPLREFGPFRIMEADFPGWVLSSPEEQFNFVHCDFPYGINLQDSAQMTTSAFEGQYEDDPDLYWLLIQALIDAKELAILSPSCHLMFWFPMSKYAGTVRRFTEAGFYVDPYPLIWHKTDKAGIVPDALRGPRRTYETALLMSLGDRKIIKPAAGSVSMPSERRTKDHASQKPLMMLMEFLDMFIDSDSVVLDPTCGSGTVLAACMRKHAKFCLGLDIDPISVEIAETSCQSAHAHMLYGAQKEKSDDE